MHTSPLTFSAVSADYGRGDTRPAWAALAIVLGDRGIPGKDATDLLRIEGDAEAEVMRRGRDGLLRFDPHTFTVSLAFGREVVTLFEPTPEAPVPVLRVIVAHYDGRPYVDVADHATAEEASRYLAVFMERDQDGGALAVLEVTGKPGETFTVRAGGVDVAVVVRL